jgi:nitric oxide reductase NorQ protein
MTAVSEEVTTKVTSIIEHISAAVSAGGDAEAARQALADIVAAQGGTTAAAAAAPPLPTVTGMALGVKTVLRPNGTEYHIRKFGDHDDVAALREARTSNLPIMAYGPPGTGKTALIEAAYAVDGQTVHTIQGTGDTETSDFVGAFTQLPGGSFEWNDGPMIKAMENGEVLYIDEIALIDPKVMAVAYSVMDGRGEYTVTQNPERGTVHAAEGFYIASACNPNAPGARLSEAIVSRFLLQFEVTTDYALAKKLGVPAKLVTAAQNLQRKYDSGEVGWAPQLRECIAFRDVAKVLGEEVALRNVIAGAPEIDRPVVQDVLQRTYGKPIESLAIA